MSRAFVREPDGEKPAALPEWPVSDAPNLVTPRGLALIEEKVASLQRAVAAEAEAGARARLARDLRYWSARLATARPTAPDPASAALQFGGAARLRDADGKESEIEIVGEDEAEPAAGRIAYTAPLARAVLGLEAGEEAEFRAGSRSRRLTVLDVTVPRRWP